MSTKAQMIEKLDAFTAAYIDCLLWLVRDENEETLDLQGECPSILTADALKQCIEDCADFQQANKAALEAAYSDPRFQFGVTQSGHDFFLTRNGHGAGFWDRGLGEVGDTLTKAAKVYGSVDPYLYRGKVRI